MTSAGDRRGGVRPGLSALPKLQREVADLQRDRQRRESAAARGEAAPLAGKPDKPVGVPARYWGDRQSESLGEMLALLPVIEAVAGLGPMLFPPQEMTETSRQTQIDEMLNTRYETLMRARKIVTERLRKEL